MKIISISTLLLVLTSCAALNNPNRMIEVVKNERDVRYCTNLGDMIASGHHFGMNNAENDMKTQTINLGGDTLLIEGYYKMGKAVGVAYKCDSKNFSIFGR